MKDSFLTNHVLPQVKGELFLPLNEFSKRKHVEALCGTKKDVALLTNLLRITMSLGGERK